MTSRERVKAAISHQPCGRVPHVVDLDAKAWEALADRVEADSPAAFCDNDVLDVCPPWWSFDYENLPADWLDIDPPTSELGVQEIGSWAAFERRLEAVADSGKYLLVRLYGIHFEQGHFTRGFGNFIADMAGEQEFVRRFLDDCVERNLRYMAPFLARPEIDGVLLGSDWGSQKGLLISTEMFDQFLRPGEQRMIDAIHAAGKDVWLHSCGDMAELIPAVVEMGYDVLNPLEPECMDIPAIKLRFGGDLCLWGAISAQGALKTGTPDDVRADARRVRDTLSVGGGYIFGPTQELPADIPPENLQAFLDVAREPVAQA